MKTEQILNTDVLDIIFNNRNKAYGAYELRKHYNQRLKKSIAITTLFVAGLFALQSFKPTKTNDFIAQQLGDGFKLHPYEIPKEEIKKPEQSKAATKQKINQEIFTPPVITPEPKAQTTVPNTNVLDTSNIGSTKITNGNNGGGLLNNPTEGKSGGGLPIGSGGNSQTEAPEEPIDHPSVYPEFPGGATALKRFMLANLTNPDDVEEGQRIEIIVKFIVDKNGNISNIEIIKNGREDLDEEVIRVISKMPAWKPGFQNGEAVPVNFRMPVVFSNNN